MPLALPLKLLWSISVVCITKISERLAMDPASSVFLTCLGKLRRKRTINLSKKSFLKIYDLPNENVAVLMDYDTSDLQTWKRPINIIIMDSGLMFAHFFNISLIFYKIKRKKTTLKMLPSPSYGFCRFLWLDCSFVRLWYMFSLNLY